MTDQDAAKSHRYRFDTLLMKMLETAEYMSRQVKFIQQSNQLYIYDKPEGAALEFTNASQRSIHNIFHELCLLKEQLLILHNAYPEPGNPNFMNHKIK